MATHSGGVYFVFREAVADETGPWVMGTAWAAVAGTLLTLAIDSGGAYSFFKEAVSEEMGPWATTTAWASVTDPLSTQPATSSHLAL